MADRGEAIYAHSQNDAEQWHLLSDHLRRVGELASERVAPALAGRARLSGLAHDMGKVSDAFQARLRGAPGAVDHKTAGACWAFERRMLDVALAIDGHHGGLPSHAALMNKYQRPDAERPLLQQRARALVPELDEAPGPLPPELKDRHALDLHVRMLFSALVDADFLDTEAHFQGEGPGLARRAPPLQPAERLAALARHMAQKIGDAPDTPVNALRRHIFQSVGDAGARPRGCYSLTVPTGGGKTLAGLHFTLRHAERHGLRRVIVVLPYINIIEQTASVYREIFGEQTVLEHHGSVTGERDSLWARLAAENWESPIIVTTAVQFFESLLGNRPSSSRKLHNIARSVVILDEVQTLPPKLLTPLLSVLRGLVTGYEVSLLLSTATMPLLREAPKLAQGLPEGLPGVEEVAPDPPRLFRALRRVAVEWPAASEQWPLSRVASEMRAAGSALCILNTRAQARELAEALGRDALHLSTAMCPAHRQEVLAEIRQRLRSGGCLVTATQLIEAGVDVDFPLVLRALGPLDSIAQAAGRCNREGRLPRGRVIVFRPEEHKKPPGVYAQATAITEQLLARGIPDLDDPDTYRAYFRELYLLVDRDGKGIQESRRELDFPAVAQDARLIEEETEAVVVPHGQALELVRAALARGLRLDRALARELRRHSVALPKHRLSTYEAEGLVQRHSAPARSPVNGHEELAVWVHRYDPQFGIDPGPRSATDLII